jgi:hypothetical protein
MVDHVVYVGYYLTVGNINVKCDTPEIGCPTCKTRDTGNKFCGFCGHAIEDYSRPSAVISVDDLVCLAEDQGVIQNADTVFENFWIDKRTILLINSQDGVGLSIAPVFDFEEYDIPELDEKKALDSFKDIIYVLDKYEIPYTMEKGIVLTCRQLQIGNSPGSS